jgi:hypothetical protein
MSGCRFQQGMGIYIRPDEDAYLAVNMKTSLDFDTELYRMPGALRFGLPLVIYTLQSQACPSSCEPELNKIFYP